MKAHLMQLCSYFLLELNSNLTSWLIVLLLLLVVGSLSMLAHLSLSLAQISPNLFIILCKDYRNLFWPNNPHPGREFLSSCIFAQGIPWHSDESWSIRHAEYFNNPQKKSYNIPNISNSYQDR